MEDSDDDDIDHRLEVDDFQCPKCGSCDVVQD